MLSRLTILAVLAFPLAAQNKGMLASEFDQEGQQLSTECFKQFFPCLQTVFTGHPLHITAGSLAPQNGIGFGPAFVYDKNSPNWRWNINADGVVSTNASWRAGVYIKAARSASKPSTVVDLQHRPTHPLKPAPPPPAPELNFYAQAISLNQLPYYGLGNFTSRSAEALFGMREVIMGMNGTKPFGNSGFGIFGELNGRFVDIRGRTSSVAPTIGVLYNNFTAPGIGSQHSFFQAGEGVRFGRTFAAHLTLDYSATLQEFVGGNSTYSFERLHIDATHTIPFYGKTAAAPASTSFGPDGDKSALDQHKYVRNREGSVSFGLTYVASFIPSSNVVPFYFQPTLGGNDINGDRSLPSYPDYRFRAPNLLSFQGAVEHSIWGPFGLEVMASYGKVGLTRDLGFDHFRHSFGAGLTIHAGGLPQVSILFAWGGGEGTHTIASISPSLLGSSGRPSLF
jgi:hypothetical protein